MIPRRKSRENMTLAQHSPDHARCKLRKECTRNAFLFYLGHTKFPDRMAPRTARVRKPIYKHAGVTDAIQARRFIDPSTIDPHVLRRKRSEKRPVDVLPRFCLLIITTNVGTVTSIWPQRSPTEMEKMLSTNCNSCNFNLRPRTDILQEFFSVKATNF